MKIYRPKRNILSKRRYKDKLSVGGMIIVKKVLPLGTTKVIKPIRFTF